jgi:hypothetical protein
MKLEPCPVCDGKLKVLSSHDRDGVIYAELCCLDCDMQYSLRKDTNLAKDSAKLGLFVGAVLGFMFGMILTWLVCRR